MVQHSHERYVDGCFRCDLNKDEVQPQVTWVLDLDDAEELWEFLHHSRPGGYQHVHDELLEAIEAARVKAQAAVRLDAIYCATCSHPKSYHVEDRGCAMPLDPAGSPLGRTATVSHTCGCRG
jgi:hypothetical protein